jgi:glutathione S-transferase
VQFDRDFDLARLAPKKKKLNDVTMLTPWYVERRQAFERLSPLRRIPVLIDGDFSISDSSVICAYLDEAHDGHPLLPADPGDRARARWLEEYADTRLGDLLIWGLFYQRNVKPLVWNEPPDEERIEVNLSTHIPAALDYLEGELPRSGFLFGDIGLADIAVATFFRNAAYAGFEPDAGRWPTVAGFVLNTLAHPAIASLLAFEDVQRNASIKGRREALLDAGAPLASETLGRREPRFGMMRL